MLDKTSTKKKKEEFWTRKSLVNEMKHKYLANLGDEQKNSRNDFSIDRGEIPLRGVETKNWCVSIFHNFLQQVIKRSKMKVIL